ncbi:MAG: hypothetical protein ACK4VW_06465 [Anaerolineales bacterium]
MSRLPPALKFLLICAICVGFAVLLGLLLNRMGIGQLPAPQ